MIGFMNIAHCNDIAPGISQNLSTDADEALHKASQKIRIGSIEPIIPDSKITPVERTRMFRRDAYARFALLSMLTLNASQSR
ncbi:MAG: hypothetical protein LZF86_80098 [Nitrospira sp.]|nr:MAG: hypothetical protein LZF86_80098 [Nitrospira sp.]